jgi:hypothetical protein
MFRHRTNGCWQFTLGKNHNSCLENRKGDNKGIIKFLKLIDGRRAFMDKPEMFMDKLTSSQLIQIKNRPVALV